MKTVKEMLTDVRADQAQRQQLEQEQEALNTPEQTDSLTTTIPQIPDHE